MQLYDAQKATLVWQRVRGAGGETVPPSSLNGLNALLMQAATEADLYQKLSPHFFGGDRTRLHKMARETTTHTACLKGICTLVRGAPPAVQTPPSTPEPPEITLRKCYRSALSSLAEYESRSCDAEYGPAFAQMAKAKKVHCLWILELLGNLK